MDQDRTYELDNYDCINTAERLLSKQQIATKIIQRDISL